MRYFLEDLLPGNKYGYNPALWAPQLHNLIRERLQAFFGRISRCVAVAAVLCLARRIVRSAHTQALSVCVPPLLRRQGVHFWGCGMIWFATQWAYHNAPETNCDFVAMPTVFDKKLVRGILPLGPPDKYLVFLAQSFPITKEEVEAARSVCRFVQALPLETRAAHATLHAVSPAAAEAALPPQPGTEEEDAEAPHRPLPRINSKRQRLAGGASHGGDT